MAPGLRPGDWLLVEPLSARGPSPQPGQVVVVPDPRLRSRSLIKRVKAIRPDGALVLVGDAPGRSTDSRAFGPVGRASVVGVAWARYWPPRRLGRIR